ncbi:MAG: hypothetical protein JRD68_05320 [Deltaproteobacteria bacterium]|nr:hypothetical protein [Deltaproteobacteria bacterium]
MILSGCPHSFFGGEWSAFFFAGLAFDPELDFAVVRTLDFEDLVWLFLV